MPPTGRASSKKLSLHPPKIQPWTDTAIRKRAKLPSDGLGNVTSKRTRQPMPKVGSEMTRCTRSQTALRSKENEQLKIQKSGNNKRDISTGYMRHLGAVDQGSHSSICLPRECQTKGEKRKKDGKTSKDSKRQKHSTSKSVKGRPKASLLDDDAKGTSSAQAGSDLVPHKTIQVPEETKCTLEVSLSRSVDSDSNDDHSAPNRHQVIKARIRLVRQEIINEQARVEKLREKLARNNDSAQASLSYRRIRIHKELMKLKDSVQVEDKKRLKAEDCRIQRQLDSSRRKTDSDRLSMQIELAKEWRDKFQRRKQEVSRAKRTLREQSMNHAMDKRELLKQLKKAWSIEQDKVQDQRDKIETQMVKEGQQWDGESWTGLRGKHKYSLRRAPREKTQTYGRACKKNNKKGTACHEDVPENGGTVYKETKRKTLSELFQVLDELRCSVCSELFISPVVLNCSHTFCSYCINQWTRRTDCCPICRTSITSRNPMTKLDSFITKTARRVGGEAEKKRSETIKDRQELERELKQGGRSWGNIAGHSLDDLDDDFNGSLDSDDSDVSDFLEILQHRVGGSVFRRFFGFGLGYDDDDEEDDFDEIGSSSSFDDPFEDEDDLMMSSDMDSLFDDDSPSDEEW